MNTIAKLASLEQYKKIRDVHFWILIAILVGTAIVYYGWQDWFPWYWRFFLYEYNNNVIGILFLLPFLYASLIFRWRGSILTWSLSAAVMLPIVIDYSPNFASLLNNVALSVVPLTIVIIFTLELKWRERQREIASERELERQIYMSQIFKAQEDERQRIAQELHDGTTQELLVIANRAQDLLADVGRLNTMEIKEQTEWIKDTIVQISDGIRRLSLDLRPSILDNIGLVPALRWLVDRVNQESEINTTIVVNGVEQTICPETEATIFRIVQEALTNIRRHSNATEATINLKFGPHSLEIMVRDNGKGFILNKMLSILAVEGKLGIIGMHQRVKLLHGSFDIKSELGRGTSIAISVAT